MAGLPRRVAADVDRVGVRATVDRGRTTDGPDVDDVGAVVAVEIRDVRVRALDRKGIVAGTEADVERFDRAVGGTYSHAQTGDLRRSQVPGIGAAVAGVIKVKGIGSAVPVDTKASTDSIYVSACFRGKSADINRIVFCTGINGRLGINGPDVDGIRTAVGPNCRFRTAGNVTEVHVVVVIAAVHVYLIRVDRAEQVNDGESDVVAVTADDNASSCLDERSGLKEEVRLGEQLDRATRRRHNRDTGFDQQLC